MMHVLVSGFSTFPGVSENPSELLMRRLADAPAVSGLPLVTTVLPVTYSAVERHAKDLAVDLDCQAYIAFGLAQHRRALEIETLAMNHDDGCTPDQSGALYAGAIVRGAPPAIATTLPVTLLADSLAESGYRTAISDFAGGYVCNHLMYCTLYALQQAGRRIPMGFVHVPPLRDGFTLDVLTAAASQLIETTVATCCSMTRTS